MKKRQRFGHQESNHAFGRWWAAFFTSAFPARPTAKIDWPTLPKLLSLRQTARLLGVHPNTLRGWDHKGKLTAVRIGQRRDRRFEKGVVLSFWQRTHGQMEKKRAPNHHWLGQPQIRGPIRIGLAFAFLLMVGSTWIGFRPAQAGNSKTLVTLMPTECHGWTGAQNAETIQLPVSATDHEFTEQNSAVFRAASNRVQSQGPGLTSGSLDAVSNVLTCSHFAADGLSPGTNLSDGVVHLSFRGKFSPNSPDSVTIDASLDGRTWVPIKTVPDSGTGALGGPVTLSTELSKHLSTIQIRLVADVDIASVTTLWLDGIGITATPILPPSKANVPEKQAQLDRLTAFSQASYDASRQPLLTLPTRRPHKNALFVTTSYDEWQLEAVKVFDSHGTEYAAKYVATETRDGSSANLNIKLDTYRLHPGKYVVHLQVRDPDGQVETISKVFLWGVVALNFRQATINVGSQESIGVGVLDDEGRTLCGANLLVKITDPRGGVRSNTTGDHSVAVNKHCIDKGVTNEPDYAFGYTPAIPGLYYVHLEAKTPAGKRSLDETFQAAPSQKFEVDRVEYPTRIYPPAAYPTRMAITPHRDYLGIVTERVPSDFALSHILAGGTIQPDPDDDHQQIVSWPVEWQKDKTYYLGYTFQAPDISPALFQTGPMQIGGGITLEPDFAERRQWQIASDANGDPAKVMHGVLQAPSSLRGQVVTSLQASKTLFRSEDSPSFVLPPSNDPVRGPIKRVRLIDAFSQPSDVHLADRTAADVPRQLVIDRSNGFHPGRYTVEVTYDSQQPTPVVDTQTFVWGVLVVNTEKSVYRPGETARFDMTTLDATGKTLCESDLTLEVTSPSGQKTTLSTGDGSIVRNYTCDDHSVTDNPDYSAQYVVAEAGAYQLHMTSVQTAGQARTGASDSFSIDDSFEVRNQVPFDISRAGTATRLYPVADYTARFSIVANQDYQGTVTETAPQSFRLYQISDGGAVVPTLDPEQQTVGWTVDWKAGQTYTLSYAFDPPNPSPRVYPLGPLTMGGFHESRQWELAADATKVWIGSGADANWSTSGNWSPSGAPASGDTIVFDGSAGGSPDNNSTWDASAQASMTSLTISTYSGTLTISVTSPTLTGAFSDTSTNGLTFTGALALSVGGDFTLTTSGTVTPNTSTVTLTGTSNTLNSSKNLYNLTYNPASTGTMTMATNDFSVTNVLDVEANGTLSLNSSRTLTLSLTSGSALTLNGTISGSGTLYYQTTTTFPSGGTLSSALTLNVSNGNITMSARTLGGAVKITSATSTGGSIIPASGSLTITGALTVDASSTGDTRFDNRTNNATVSVGGASCTSGGTKRILMGTSSNTSTGDFNLANCNTTSDFGSNSTLTMSGATTNLNLSSTGPTTLVISAAGTVTLTGGATPTNLTTNSGATLAFGSQTLSMSGTFTSNGTASGSSGLLIYQSTTNYPSTGTVSVPVRLDDRNGNITVTSGTTFGGDVTVFNGGTSAARSVILGGATTFQGALTINAPTSQNSTLDGGTNNPAVSVTGDFTFSKGSTGLPSWTTGTGTWTFSGAVNLTNGTVTITSGNTIAMNAGSTKTLTTASNTLQHLTISGAATLGDATAIAGNLDMTGGTVTANSQTVTLSGTSNTVTGGSNTLYNVTLSGSASYTLQTSNLTISNILTVAAGTTWNINSTIFTFLTLNSATNSLSLNSTGTIGGSGTISYASATSNAFPTVGTVNATVRYDATNGNLNAVSRTYGGGIEAYSNSTSARSVFVGTATGQTISETTLSVNANNTASVTLDASNGGTYNNVISASSNFSCTKGSTGAPTIITGTGNWTISGNTDFTNCTVTATATNNLIMNGTGGKTLTGGSATLANLQITSANDTVTLQTTSLTVNTLLTIANTSTLSINSSITLTLSGNSGTTFTNTGTCSGAGQIIYQNSATTFPSGGGSVNCAVRLDALNGNMSVPARTFGGALDLYSNTANARTITPGTAGSQTITVSGALTFTTGSSQTQLFTIAGATNSPAMNVTGDFSTTKSGSGSMTFTTGAGTWTMSGAVNFSNITTLTAATNNLFVLNGSSKTLTGNSKTLYQLQISGDTTASGALTVSNLLTVDANKTYTLSGTVTLSATSGTSLTLNGTIGGTSVLIYRTTTAFPTSGTINSQLRMDCGQVANSVLILSARTYGGTVLPYDTTTNNCTVQLGTAGSQTLTLSAGFTPTNTSTGVLTVDGSTWNPAVTISGDFTTNTGNSPTFNAGTGTWTVSGNVDWAGGGPLTYTAGTGNTFIMNGTTKTLTSNGDTFYNLTISSAVTLADSFTVANNLDLTSSTLDATTNLTTVTMTGASGTLTGGGQTLYNLTISSASGGVTLATSDLTVSNTLQVDAAPTLTINASRLLTLSANSGTSLTLNGTITGSGTLVYQNSATTVTTSGTLSSAFRFDVVNGNETIPNRTFGGAVVGLNGTSSARQLIFGTAVTPTFSSSLDLQTTGTGTLLLDGATNNPTTVTVTGNFTTSTANGAVTVSMGSGTWTMSGNFDLTNVTTFNNNSGTLTMSGASKTLTSNSKTLNNVNLAGSITLANATHTIAGNLDLTSGTITAGTSTVDMTGTSKTLVGAAQTLKHLTIDGSITAQTTNLTVSGTLTVSTAKTLTITTVTITSDTGGTVTMNGTGTISGTGTLKVRNSNLEATNGTLSSAVSFDPNDTNTNLTMPARTYGGAITISNSTTSGGTVTPASGTQALSSSLTITDAATTGVTFAGNTSNPTVNVTGDVTVSSGGTTTLSMGSGTWTASGNFNLTNLGTLNNNSGTLTMNGSSKTLTSNGKTLNNVTLSGSITLANATHTIAGNLSLASGTITAGTSTVTMTGAGATLTGGSQTLANLTISNTSGTITLQTSDLTVSTTLTTSSNSSLTIDTGRTLTLSANSGTSFSSSGTCASTTTGVLVYQNSAATFPTAGTVNCNVRFDTVNGNLTVPARTFGGNLEAYGNTNNTRSVTLGTASSQTINISGNLTVTSGASQTPAVITLTGSSRNPAMNITGDLSFSKSGSTPAITTGSGNWTVSGNVTMTNGTFTASTNNTMTMDGTSKTLVGGSYKNLTIAGTVTAQTTNVSVDTTLTVNTTKTLTITGVTVTSGTSGTVTISGTGTIGGTGTLKVQNSNLGTAGTLSANVTFDPVSSNITMSARTYGGNVTVTGDIASTVTMNSGTHTISGNLLLDDGAGSSATNLDGSTNSPTVNLTGNFSAVDNGVPTDYTLSLGGGTWTVSGSFDLSALSGGGTFNSNSGTLLMNGTGTLTSSGFTLNNLQVNSSGTVTLAAATHTVAGGLLLGGSGTPTVTGSTISMTGTGQTIDGGSKTLNNLTISGTVTLQNTSLTVSGTLQVDNTKSIAINSGMTLTHSGTTLTLNGTISGAGTLIIKDTSTGPGTSGTLSSGVRFDATAANIASTTLDARTYGGAVELYSNSGSARSLTFPTGTFVFSSSLTTTAAGAGAVTVDVDTNDPTVTVTGALTIGATTTFSASSSGAFNVNGNYTNNGTFTNNSGTVTLAGSSQQTLSGSMTGSTQRFNNLTITNASGSDPDSSPSVIFAAAADANGTFTAATASTKLRFNAGSTYTFTAINFNGQATGTRVYLHSSTTGTQWHIVAGSGSRTVSYTSVKDSDACSSTGGNIDGSDGTNVAEDDDSCWNIAKLTVAVDTTTAALGTLDLTHVNQAGIVTTITTSAPNGYVSMAKYSATLTDATADTIADVGGSTIAAGTATFGAASSRSGNTIALWSPTSCATTTSTSNATALTTSFQSYASASGTVSSQATTLCFAAGISNSTKPGSYSSTITVVTTAKF